MQKARSAGDAVGLTREYVTSEEIFELETDRIFSQNWICVGRESDLKPDRGAVPVAFEDHKLILVKTGDSSVKAMCNYCRHRGSMLVTESNCAQIGKRIQCPYHAWTYDREGKLLAAPNMDGVENFRVEEFGLIQVPCETFAGFTWVNFSPQQPLEQFMQPLQSQADDWGIADLRVAHEIGYEVRANWKLIFQNYSECYHCPNVHPALNRLTPYNHAANLLEEGPILGGPMQLSDESETMSMTGKKVGERLPGLSDVQARSVNYFTIFPTVFLSTHPDYVLLHRLERLTMNSTKVICQFLFHPDIMNQSGFDPSPAVEFWDMTNRQDWEVCELAQAGMEDRNYQPGPYSNLESVLAAFDRYYHRTMN